MSEINKIKVSIILPSLNVVEYMRECLESVCSQTLDEIEIICVDAGSTDGTLDIIKEFKEKDERIQLIHSSKKSYGYQMNLGIKAASGLYIGIVETDDCVPKEMYAYLYTLAERNDVDFIKADFFRFVKGEDGDEILFLNQLSSDKSIYNRVINPRKEKKVFSLIMNTWSGIYKRDFIIRNNIYHNESPGASYQDTDFWFQTFCLAERAYFLDKPLYLNRRDNPNSSVYSNSKIYAFCDEYDFIYNRLFASGRNKDLLPEFQFYRYRSYMSSLNKCNAEQKAKFVKKFKEDLMKSQEKNELNMSLFTAGGRRTVDLILNNTEKFIVDQQEKPQTKYALSSNSKTVLQKSNMDKDIKISVIIPVFNAEKYLKECLESVLNQKLKEIEVIVVDDGSTDNSLQIVKNLREKDKRITILTQPNSGSGEARNFGLTLAKGEYIAFMDADDWYPDREVLALLYEKAKKNKAGICGGSFSHFKEGKLITKFSGALSKYTFQKEGFVNYSDYQFDYGYHRFIYCRDLIALNKIKFPDLLRFQDPPFFIECMLKAEKFYAIPNVVYTYRKGQNTVNWTETKIKDLINGIIYELQASSENNLAGLHRLAADHLNVDFNSIIGKFVSFDYPQVIELLFVANGKINKELLIKGGYKITLDATYLIKPLREFKRKFSPRILSVEVKTTNGKFVYEESNDNELERLKEDNKKLLAKNMFLKNTVSYKVGRAITYIPRKILSILK